MRSWTRVRLLRAVPLPPALHLGKAPTSVGACIAGGGSAKNGKVTSGESFGKIGGIRGGKLTAKCSLGDCSGRSQSNRPSFNGGEGAKGREICAG